MVLDDSLWLALAHNGPGLILGHGQSTFDFITISTDPFVVAFQLTTILLIAAVSFWVWFLGGALVLAPYLELTPFKVKLQFAAGMLLVAFVAIMVWLSRSASPH